MAKQLRTREPGPDRMLDAALALAGELPWRRVTMEAIARESGASLAECASSSLTPLSCGHSWRGPTPAVMADHDFADASEPTRERLLM